MKSIKILPVSLIEVNDRVHSTGEFMFECVVVLADERVDDVEHSETDRLLHIASL